MKVKSNLRISLLVSALLAVALFSIACGDIGNKIVKFSDKARHSVEQLQESQTISADEADQIKPLISDVRSAGQAYADVERIVATTKEEKATRSEKLRDAGQAVIDALKRLDSEGVLRVKNPKAREYLTKSLAVASIILEFAQ